MLGGLGGLGGSVSLFKGGAASFNSSWHALHNSPPIRPGSQLESRQADARSGANTAGHPQCLAAVGRAHGARF